MQDLEKSEVKTFTVYGSLAKAPTFKPTATVNKLEAIAVTVYGKKHTAEVVQQLQTIISSQELFDNLFSRIISTSNNSIRRQCVNILMNVINFVPVSYFQNVNFSKVRTNCFLQSFQLVFFYLFFIYLFFLFKNKQIIKLVQVFLELEVKFSQSCRAFFRN